MLGSMRGNFLVRGLRSFDWILGLSLIPIFFFSLMTMNSFSSANHFFNLQLVWVIISLIALFLFSLADYRFLRQSVTLVALYGASLFLLLVVLAFGHIANGAKSWLSFGLISFQPVDPMKVVLVLLLAKYFSRRHIEIANFRHIFVSGVYAVVPFLLIYAQPDFGSAVVIFFLWLGLTMVSGISKKHLFAVFSIGILAVGVLWFSVFHEYQKKRILNFIHPVSDVRGSGYNVYQSTIAVGSGGLLGKGVGFGTQSRLQFLPEHETDFIFAAFAEEWGFVGVMLLFLLYGIIFWRILYHASRGASNFEVLYACGIALYFMTHIIINVGMNMGVLPVTGLPLPFMSYGGSHVLTECIALGILIGMSKYGRATHASNLNNEVLGLM